MKSIFGSLTYRQVAKDYIVCTDYRTCRRKLSKTRHVHGYADRMGHLHWAGFDGRMTRAGLRRVLLLIADVHFDFFHHPVPNWERIWRREVYAYNTALHTYHIRIPIHLSTRARSRALQWAQKETPSGSVRSISFAAYQWMIRR